MEIDTMRRKLVKSKTKKKKRKGITSVDNFTSWGYTNSKEVESSCDFDELIDINNKMKMLNG